MNYWKFLEKKQKKTNLFCLNNFLTWNVRHQIWLFLSSGFYFDDFISFCLKSFFLNILLIPSFFILDKWFSYWTGFGVLKFYLRLFNSIFYFEQLDVFFFINSLIVSFIFIFIFFFTLTLFFN